MKSIRAVVVMLALAVCALPDAVPAASTPFGSQASAALAPGRLRQLKGVDELKSWFNGSRGHPRLIFLVSPT